MRKKEESGREDEREKEKCCVASTPTVSKVVRNGSSMLVGSYIKTCVREIGRGAVRGMFWRAMDFSKIDRDSFLLAIGRGTD